jgi:Cft2 family RNA processing exonuclease
MPTAGSALSEDADPTFRQRAFTVAQVRRAFRSAALNTSAAAAAAGGVAAEGGSEAGRAAEGQKGRTVAVRFDEEVQLPDGVAVSPARAGGEYGASVWRISKSTETIIYAPAISPKSDRLVSKSILYSKGGGGAASGPASAAGGLSGAGASAAGSGGGAAYGAAVGAATFRRPTVLITSAPEELYLDKLPGLRGLKSVFIRQKDGDKAASTVTAASTTAPGSAALPASKSLDALTEVDAELVDRVVLPRVRSGGSVLIPVDSTGRGLEVLLRLESQWRREYPPLVLLGRYAATMLELAKTMLEYASDKISRTFSDDRVSPFQLQNTIVLQTLADFDRLTRFKKKTQGNNASTVPCVVITCFPSLETGLARDLALRWAHDKNSLILFTDKYDVPAGSLASQLLFSRAASRPLTAPGHADSASTLASLMGGESGPAPVQGQVRQTVRVPLQGFELRRWREHKEEEQRRRLQQEEEERERKREEEREEAKAKDRMREKDRDQRRSSMSAVEHQKRLQAAEEAEEDTGEDPRNADVVDDDDPEDLPTASDGVTEVAIRAAANATNFARLFPSVPPSAAARAASAGSAHRTGFKYRRFPAFVRDEADSMREMTPFGQDFDIEAMKKRFELEAAATAASATAESQAAAIAAAAAEAAAAAGADQEDEDAAGEEEPEVDGDGAATYTEVDVDGPYKFMQVEVPVTFSCQLGYFPIESRPLPASLDLLTEVEIQPKCLVVVKPPAHALPYLEDAYGNPILLGRAKTTSKPLVQVIDSTMESVTQSFATSFASKTFAGGAASRGASGSSFGCEAVHVPRPGVPIDVSSGTTTFTAQLTPSLLLAAEPRWRHVGEYEVAVIDADLSVQGRVMATPSAAGTGSVETSTEGELVLAAPFALRSQLQDLFQRNLRLSGIAPQHSTLADGTEVDEISMQLEPYRAGGACSSPAASTQSGRSASDDEEMLSSNEGDADATRLAKRRRTAAAEGGVVLLRPGTVHVSDIRKRLAKKGIETDIRDGMLVTRGCGILVRKSAQGSGTEGVQGLQLEGPLCEEYYAVRRVLYEFYAVCQ